MAMKVAIKIRDWDGRGSQKLLVSSYIVTCFLQYFVQLADASREHRIYKINESFIV